MILAKNEGLSHATVNFSTSGCSSAVTPCRGMKPQVRAGGTTAESTAEPLQRAAENCSDTAVAGLWLLWAWGAAAMRGPGTAAQWCSESHVVCVDVSSSRPGQILDRLHPRGPYERVTCMIRGDDKPV